MASVFKGMNMVTRFIAKRGRCGPDISSTSIRAFAASAISPVMHEQGEGFTDELFARGWCGYTASQRTSFPKPLASQMFSSPLTSFEEARLLDELYMRGWFTSEVEVTQTTQDESEGAVLNELYARGWSTSSKLADVATAGKHGLDDVVAELFARGWTWHASFMQVFKKPAVNEIPPPSKTEHEDVLLNELFVRGWESFAVNELFVSDIRESGPLGEELFVRGW